MTSRQYARRLLVAAPALALTALAAAACTPPHEQPADPDAPYTLPSYSEPESAHKGQSHSHSDGTHDAMESGAVEVTSGVVSGGTVVTSVAGEGAAAATSVAGQAVDGVADAADGMTNPQN